MRERIMSMLRRGTVAFGQFTMGQKAMVIVAVLALAVGGYFFTTWAAQPTYAPLFTNLTGTDASAIVDKLTADGTPYKLTDSGSTIMVPTDQVYAQRIKMSGAGLPAQGDVGYALLDKQGAMTSEFMQQVGYKRALEGELTKTIKAIDGVNTAIVNLNMPKKDVFTDEQEKASASVMVVPSAGKKLRDEQVQAIVHLVASSVEGLDPEQVTVADSNGTMLSAAGQAETAAGDLRAKQTQGYEQRMNTALQRMLDQALGAGHAVVQVTADLDLDNTQTTTQRYVAPDPDTPALSETTKNERYTGTGVPVGGVLGPDNIQVPTGADGTGEYSQENATRNNAVGMISETRKAAPGNVRKLAVAVLLDSAKASEDQAAQLQQLIGSAAGLDPARGDTIAVSTMTFDTTAAKQAKQALADAKKAESDAQLRSWIETGAIAGAIVVLLLAAFLSGRKRRPKKPKKEKGKKAVELTAAERAELDAMQAAIDQAKLEALMGGDGDGDPALTGGEPDDPAALEASDLIARQRSISSLIEKQPEDVAQLLRSWLADRRA